MRAHSGRPRLLRDGRALSLAPVPLPELHLYEDELQDLLDRYPDLLPVEEIGSAWGPLVSLGREIETPAGPIDNLFVSPRGQITVVETKLWRNPEARRKVVAQVLDYASELARMSFEDLDARVRNARGGVGIWETVCASDLGGADFPEAEFVDSVAANLRSGRFLLLVVGDGIRSGLHVLAELLAAHPTLGFHLELVELRLYDTPDGDRVVIPALLGRTVEVTRAVITISKPDDINVHVTTVPTDGGTGRRPKIGSIDEFVTRAAALIGEGRAEAVATLAHWWQEAEGGAVHLESSSIALWARAPGRPETSVMSFYVDGTAQASIGSLVETRRLVSHEDAQAHFESAGFEAGSLWPARQVDVSIESEMLRLQELLRWAAGLLRPPKGQPDG